MLKVLMEFRKGVLFVRLYGLFSSNEINDFEKEVKEVIIKLGIRYVVINMKDLNEISKDGIKEIKKLKKILKKQKGDLFLIASEIKELKTLINLENELKVFEKVVI